MFESLKQENSRNAARHITSLFLSLVAHVMIVGIILLMPLVFFNVLHADELVAFLIEPPTKLPDPPEPPAPPVRTAARGTQVFTGDYRQTPDRIPEGIPVPNESDMAPVIGKIVEGINPPGQAASAGPGIGDILARHRVVEPPMPTPPAPHPPVRVSSGVQESKLIFKAAPVYPPLAIQARVSGKVLLEAEIDEDGNVARVNIVSGHPLLVNAAADAVKKWRYSPTILNGEPQTVLAIVTVVFRLQ